MKEKRDFPLFNTAIDLAHMYWKKGAQKLFWAIDATCGNGHDTLVLSQIFSGIIALDIQKIAIENTRLRIGNHDHVHFFCQSHESFPKLAHKKPISLIVYNLGYLPGGNKKITTQSLTTLKSLVKAMDLLLPGGTISITCYPGHAEGAFEEKTLLAFAQDLNPAIWSVCHHKWFNRKRAPSLLLLQKTNN